ncbi:MAG: hypothetical protein VR65_04570 [Desulfobulbaceae bacterium BRH_c16a]|nr:MAG: hypothetical protein VR65_04570 [Desulfobulbaceae bacterium BRH_c16a]
MAFTFRATDDHNKILDEISQKNGFNTRSKALSWMIENFSELVSSRDAYFRKMHQASSQLTELRSAVKNKLIADQNLKHLVEDYGTDNDDGGDCVDEKSM